MTVRSYPSIWNLGNPNVAELFHGVVVIQEKIDGSQFTFGKLNGELVCRSKGKDIVIGAPDTMFTKAVATAQDLFARNLLPDGILYRGEYLRTPSHNTLKYDRVPKGNIILFDIDDGNDTFFMPESLAEHARLMDLESVPVFFHGEVTDFEQFKALTERESCLGGVKMEGVVIKNYIVFGRDKRPVFGKYVRPEFKEENKTAFRAANPTQGDVVQKLIEIYRNENRWRKAAQHLRDAGVLESSMRDIPKLMKEVPADVLKECEDEIKEALWKWAWPKIQRGMLAGLPEWWKEELARSQFEEPKSCE